MAIAFARMEVISRSNGGSATRTAAYIHRIEVKDSRSGERFDFRHSAQAGDQHGVLLPEGAPDWMPDPARLWDAAERAERRKDSQTAYHIVVALPKATDGLGAEDQRALVESFAREQWGRHGLAVSFAIHPPHEGEDNWHAHILVTTRRVEGNGLVTRKARDLNPAFTRSVEGGLHVDGERWGALWAEHQNRYFEAQGLELRVDRKGVISQEHLGPKRHRADPEAEMRQERAEAEAETAIAWRDPGTVLTLMTRTRATFTFAELDRELGKALPVTAERERVRRAVLGDAALIRLRDWGGGAALDRYTTRAVIAEERCVLDDIGRTLKHRHRVDPAVMAAVAARRTLRPDQERACRAAWDGAGVVMIVGRAGTGKSHAIGALAEGYRQCGFTVVGLGPTNLIGQTLAAEPEITRGGTLHSELWHLEQGSRRWDRSTVVVVDEAAMVDSPTMARLTRAAAESGAKLILVGDARQLSSVERGGLFAELRNRLQGPVIETVTRQREDWQRRAAEHLAAGRHDLALSAFADEGCLRWSETQDEARAALVRQWESDRIARPDRSRFVFAYTNEDVDQLNAALRAVRQRRGELGEEVLLPTDRGERLFAVGDRVQITATDKGVGLVNGQVGTIEAIRGRWVALRRDDGRRVEFDAGRFHGFRHGYAGTIYKGQGRTLDETYLYHSRHWRSAASYVALTRQRHQALIFAATETAADTRSLARQMARADDRRAASAYQPDEDWLKAREREAAAAAALGENFKIPPLDEETQAALDEWEAAMREGGGAWAPRDADEVPVDPVLTRHRQAAAADRERQRRTALRLAAEQAEALALLLDGRSLTRLADGRIEIEGLTKDQRESVNRHWPALSAAAEEMAARQAEERQRREAERLAAEQAAEREHQRIARDAEQRAMVGEYLNWLAVTQMEREAAIKAGDRPAYLAAVFRRRDGAARFAATGLMPLLHQIDAKAAETTAILAVRPDAEVRATANRRLLKIASERATAVIPELAAPLIAAMAATGTPEPWRLALTDALAKPNRLESAVALWSLANEVKGVEDQAIRHRQDRAALETALDKAHQALDNATGHLWDCCQQASRDPEADYQALEALTHTITEEQMQGRIFAPPSGLRGGIVFARDERRNAEQAAADALPAALRVRIRRAAARIAADRLSAYDTSPAAQAGQQAETAVAAMAHAVGTPRTALSAWETLMHAVSALETGANFADIHAARIPDDLKQAILSERRKAQAWVPAPRPAPPQDEPDWEPEDNEPDM